MFLSYVLDISTGVFIPAGQTNKQYNADNPEEQLFCLVTDRLLPVDEFE